MSTLRTSPHRPFLPQTNPGRIAVTLVTLFAIVAIAQGIVTRITGSETSLAFLLFLAMVTGIVGGIMALVLVLRGIDRSIAVFLTAGVAALPLLFILVEVLFPHA